MALLWAAGIIWLALDYTSSSDQTPDNQSAADATQNATG